MRCDAMRCEERQRHHGYQALAACRCQLRSGSPLLSVSAPAGGTPGGLTTLVGAVAGTLPVPIKNRRTTGKLARQELTSDDSGRTQPGSNDERCGHITHANDRRPDTGSLADAR
jgi:hypothetical protein